MIDLYRERRREAIYRAQHSGLSRAEMFEYRVMLFIIVLSVGYFVIRSFMSHAVINY